MQPVTGVATAAGVALAAVFAWAGLAKLARPARTRSAFRDLALPAPALLARAVPATEVALAALLASRPRAGGAAVLALLALFSAFLGRRLARGATGVGCGCFGSARRGALAPVELVRNGLLALLAVAALGAVRPAVPPLPAAVTVSTAVAVGLVILALVDLRAATGSVWRAEPLRPEAAGSAPATGGAPR